jgi:hypothetical protein
MRNRSAPLPLDAVKATITAENDRCGDQKKAPGLPPGLWPRGLAHGGMDAAGFVTANGRILASASLCKIAHPSPWAVVVTVLSFWPRLGRGSDQAS